MANRKKRLQKGIDSLYKQIKLHEEKLKKADEEDKILDKIVIEKKLNEADFLRLYEKLNKYKEEINMLKKQRNNLIKKITILEKNISIRPVVDSKRIQYFGEHNIRFLEGLIKNKNQEIEELKLFIRRFNNVISNISDFYILKKLDNLGLKELNSKNKVLNIKRNDILLIENPNIISSSIVDFLKDRVFIIVHKKPISEKIENLPFIFLNSKNLKMDEDKYFSFVEKKSFDMEKDKVNWVKKIIDDYKREKQQLA